MLNLLQGILIAGNSLINGNAFHFGLWHSFCIRQIEGIEVNMLNGSFSIVSFRRKEAK
jgi:hypothetical protein